MFEKLFGKGRDRPHRTGWSCSWANAGRHWPPLTGRNILARRVALHEWIGLHSTSQEQCPDLDSTSTSNPPGEPVSLTHGGASNGARRRP